MVGDHQIKGVYRTRKRQKRGKYVMLSDRVRYQYNCTSPCSIGELTYILEHERPISYGTFRQKVNSFHFKSLVKELGYPFSSRRGLIIKEDKLVTYHKSRLPDGRKVYFLRYSGMEYIFY